MINSTASCYCALPMHFNSFDDSPGFIGIGTQKAGTTWLYAQLARHPFVWMPPIKELHYFDRSPKYPSPNGLFTASPISRIWMRDSHHKRQCRRILRSLPMCIISRRFSMIRWGIRWVFGYYNDHWYKSLFRDAPSNSISGEITPAYATLNREDIEWMRRINPSVKIILLVRNPIDRAWSALRFYKKIGRFKKNFECVNEALVALTQEEITRRGDYSKIIGNYLEIFDSRQILICFYDSIEEKPVELLHEIYAFLGIPSVANNRELLSTRYNVSPAHEMPQEIRSHLEEIYKPSIEEMAERYSGYFNTWRQNLGRERPVSNEYCNFPAAINP